MVKRIELSDTQNVPDQQHLEENKEVAQNAHAKSTNGKPVKLVQPKYDVTDEKLMQMIERKLRKIKRIISTRKAFILAYRTSKLQFANSAQHAAFERCISCKQIE